jgi:hypothetical protein
MKIVRAAVGMTGHRSGKEPRTAAKNSSPTIQGFPAFANTLEALRFAETKHYTFPVPHAPRRKLSLGLGANAS